MIESTIKHIEYLLDRRLTEEEIFIIGVSYQKGFIHGMNYAREGVLPEKPKGENTGETEA